MKCVHLGHSHFLHCFLTFYILARTNFLSPKMQIV
nr:MAG TPA: hypothetical protein [Caudoviricetes sp.]